ncbi:MAG TPA: hypothetical protein VLB75_02660 [Steroidobacteraceae bacterium]|nr:hypothetical protein [Steroidobacteraceae bacterium]
MPRRALIGLLLLVALAMGGAGGYWLGSSQSSKGAAGISPRKAADSESAWSAPLDGDTDSDDAERMTLADDPADSLDAVLDLPDSGKRRIGLVRLGETWARSAPEDAWQEALRVDDPKARLPLLRAILSTWVEQNPGQAFAGVTELPPSWDRHQLLQQVCAEVARYDPLLALDLVSRSGLADPDSYRGIIVDEWARGDPAGAAQWIERQNLGLQARIAYRIAEAYVGQSPQEALNWALGIGGARGRTLWAHMLRQMAVYDPREALRIALSAENPSQRTTALASVVPMIAKSDPALAMSLLEKVPGNTQLQVIGEIAAQLAETSLASAVGWLDSLDDSVGPRAWSGLGGSIAYREPDVAAELLDRVPREARDQWIATIANAYAQSDPAKAVQWMRRFENEPGYAAIVQQVAMNAAAVDPESALDVIDRLAEGKKREQVLAGTMHMIAFQQPEIAARLLEEISDENLRAQAMSGVASTWAQSDLPAARKWVMSIPAGPSRDQALANMIGNVARADEDVVSLIALIQSPDLRQNAVLNAAMNLAQTNPEAMRTLLRRYPLDPRYQQHIDRMLKQQGLGD